jgi:hypothetical protein
MLLGVVQHHAPLQMGVGWKELAAVIQRVANGQRPAGEVIVFYALGLSEELFCQLIGGLCRAVHHIVLPQAPQQKELWRFHLSGSAPGPDGMPVPLPGQRSLW